MMSNRLRREPWYSSLPCQLVRPEKPMILIQIGKLAERYDVTPSLI